MKNFGLFSFFVLIFQYTGAQICNSCNYAGWNYFNKVVINNSTNPNTLSNFQVLVTLNTQTIISANKMKVDGSDIRFTGLCGGGVNYNYWIESGINTSNTRIWVNVATIPALTVDTMYMHYGNALATAVASGSLTFDYFDDFQSGSLTGWTFSGGTWTISTVNANNVLQCTNPIAGLGHAALLNSSLGLTNYYVECSAMVTTSVVYGGPLFEHNDFGNYYAYHFMVDQQNTMHSLITGGASNYTIQDPAVTAINTWYPWSMKRSPGPGGIDVVFNGVFTRTVNSAFTDGLGVWAYGAGAGLVYFDNVRVRKHSAVIPIITNYQAYATATVGALSAGATPTVLCAGGQVTFSATGMHTYSWIPGGQTGSTVIYTVNTSTNFSVIGTNTTAGCIQIKTFSITANSVPQVYTSGIYTLCNSSGTGLYAYGADSYSWSNGAQTQSVYVTPSANTSFTVTGTNTLTGCTKSAVVNVTVHPLPNVIISGGTTPLCIGSAVTLTVSGAVNYTWMTIGGTNPIVTLSPTVTTMYMAHGFNIYGCENMAMHTITVVPRPTITVADGAVCTGGVFTLNPSGALTYTYSSGSQTVMPIINSTYLITGTDANGCLSINSVVCTVSVLPLPVVTAQGMPAKTICAGEKIILSSAGANTYVWSSGANTSTTSVNPKTNTVYTVTGTDANGCESNATVSVKVNGCVGLASLPAGENGFNIFPNPSNGQFSIVTNEEAVLNIINVNGQVVRTVKTKETEGFEILVSELGSGIYIICYASNNIRMAKKIVITE